MAGLWLDDSADGSSKRGFFGLTLTVVAGNNTVIAESRTNSGELWKSRTERDQP